MLPLHYENGASDLAAIIRDLYKHKDAYRGYDARPLSKTDTQRPAVTGLTIHYISALAATTVTCSYVCTATWEVHEILGLISNEDGTCSAAVYTLF